MVIARWGEGLKAALTAESPAWCASLSKAANIKAEKMEQETMRKKQASWRALLGNGTADDGKPGAPTRTAYRWVKGICGWSGSKIGPDVQNDVIFQEEPEETDTFEDDWTTSDNFLRTLKAQKDCGTIAPAAD